VEQNAAQSEFVLWPYINTAKKQNKLEASTDLNNTGKKQNMLGKWTDVNESDDKSMYASFP